ncbi:MAG: hypothetical protein ACR2IK_08890 [Chloroflexota bacterium]
MREFTELQILSDHACSTPQIERLEVYAPIRMQSGWLTIFRCCSQMYSEPAEVRLGTQPVLRALAAQDEAA